MKINLGGEAAGSIAVALEALSKIQGVMVYRWELLEEMKKAVKTVEVGDATSLKEAIWQVRNRTRQIGRRLSRCTLGTTLLVKGLEFDHAIVLDGDSMDVKNSYVAITKGAKMLTIVSESGKIRPVKSNI
ncbi:MAG: hypothetical protein GXP49_17225 [Deltaproteobacteria bacterium]|nr:hypothetical protein [Deltaproteobacteria bacterium]